MIAQKRRTSTNCFIIVVLTRLLLSFGSANGMVVVPRVFGQLLPALHRPNKSLCTRMAAASTSSPLPEYEVEQKFALASADETTRIETRLKELGFETTQAPDVRMVDWYWDDAADNWSLTTQDCWLRLRQIK